MLKSGLTPAYGLHKASSRPAYGRPEANLRPPQVWVNPSAETPTDCPAGEDQPGPRILRAIINNEGAQQFVCLNPSCKSREPMGRFWCSSCWATYKYKVDQNYPAAMPSPVVTKYLDQHRPVQQKLFKMFDFLSNYIETHS